MARIGIPRALMYYRYFPLWQSLFKQAGCEIVLSRRPRCGYTTEGNMPGPGDICLPVKLFLAHVNDLAERCDYIFIPRLISFDSDTYNCPHFLGIPDVARAQCNFDIPLLEPVWNAKKETKPLDAFIHQIGKRLGTKVLNKKDVVDKVSENLRHSMTRFPSRMEPVLFEQIDIRQARFVIGMVGRPYILYEPELAGKIFTFFRRENVFVITPEMVSKKLKMRALEQLERPIFWYNCRENAGAAFFMFDNRRLDGLVQVVTFGCGPDSLIKELIDLEASSRLGFPYLSLVLDQQSSMEAVQTRLEAFLDMLTRKHSG